MPALSQVVDTDGGEYGYHHRGDAPRPAGQYCQRDQANRGDHQSGDDCDADHSPPHLCRQQLRARNTRNRQVQRQPWAVNSLWSFGYRAGEVVRTGCQRAAALARRRSATAWRFAKPLAIDFRVVLSMAEAFSSR